MIGTRTVRGPSVATADAAPTSGDADAIGLVLARPRRMFGLEPFMAELVTGIEDVLGPEGLSLQIQVVPDSEAEDATWRRWAERHLVRAVIMVDLAVDDPRPSRLAALGLPGVLLGGEPHGVPISNIFVDDARGARDAVRSLVGLGHRRIARVAGLGQLRHTRVRTEAFLTECSALGVAGSVVAGDYDEVVARTATQALLRARNRPTAIVYDDDVMAIAGLAAAANAGVSVPEELSVIAWDDTALCRLAHPALSVVAVDVHGLGLATGTAVLDALAGAPVTAYAAPPPSIRLRASTGPASPTGRGLPEESAAAATASAGVSDGGRDTDREDGADHDERTVSHA